MSHYWVRHPLYHRSVRSIHLKLSLDVFPLSRKASQDKRGARVSLWSCEEVLRSWTKIIRMSDAPFVAGCDPFLVQHFAV